MCISGGGGGAVSGGRDLADITGFGVARDLAGPRDFPLLPPQGGGFQAAGRVIVTSLLPRWLPSAGRKVSMRSLELVGVWGQESISD